MNKTANYQLTIIVPVYNEEGNILRLEKELGEFLKDAKVSSCVLFVNDGSKDDSERLIREVCERNEAFFFLNLARNGGLSAAMKAGIDNSFSKWVGYIDADLQTTPQDFNKLLEFVDQYEMVMGIRTGRKDSFVKNMSSRIANGFRRMMTHDGVEDTGCPLKVLRTDYAKRIPFFTGMLPCSATPAWCSSFWRASSKPRLHSKENEGDLCVLTCTCTPVTRRTLTIRRQ